MCIPILNLYLNAICPLLAVCCSFFAQIKFERRPTLHYMAIGRAALLYRVLWGRALYSDSNVIPTYIFVLLLLFVTIGCMRVCLHDDRVNAPPLKYKTIEQQIWILCLNVYVSVYRNTAKLYIHRCRWDAYFRISWR